MCAINGFNWSDRELAEKMNAVTRHRGPDGTGVYCDEHASLGHNRLNIIDLSNAASQPMKSSTAELYYLPLAYNAYRVSSESPPN